MDRRSGPSRQCPAARRRLGIGARGQARLGLRRRGRDRGSRSHKDPGRRVRDRRGGGGQDRRRHLMAAPAVTLSALRDLAAATPLSEADITSAVEQGVATAYRRLVEDDPQVRARVNLESGTLVVYRVGEDGSEEPLVVDVPDFPRQAAAAARTAVAERLASVEQRRILRGGTAPRRGL